jgi:hypothetical protein
MCRISLAALVVLQRSKKGSVERAIRTLREWQKSASRHNYLTKRTPIARSKNGRNPSCTRAWGVYLKYWLDA